MTSQRTGFFSFTSPMKRQITPLQVVPENTAAGTVKQIFRWYRCREFLGGVRRLPTDVIADAFMHALLQSPTFPCEATSCSASKQPISGSAGGLFGYMISGTPAGDLRKQGLSCRSPTDVTKAAWAETKTKTDRVEKQGRRPNRSLSIPCDHERRLAESNCV